MGEFKSDDHYIYYCGQASLRRNGVAITVNSRLWNVVLGCNLKNDRMISHCLQGKQFNIMVIPMVLLVCPNQEYWSWVWTVLWRPIRPSKTNTSKKCPFHYREMESKRRKSRDTWSNRQIWPWSTKQSRSKANRVLPRECTGHCKHHLPTTQEKTLHMDITNDQYQNQIDYILCSQRWRSSIQSAKTRLGADCGLDHELLIAKFRLKLEKVGKTTRSFRYDVNQIPYDYTVEVTNRFKGLYLIDRVPEEVWMEIHDIV